MSGSSASGDAGRWTVGRRLAAVQAPIIPIIGDLVRATPGAISLGQGVVYYGPPAEVLAAARAWGDAPEQHRYGPVQGIPPLLARIEEKLAVENGITLDQRRVVVTAGANMGFLNALFAITDPGDEVILPTPYYFNHEMAIRMLNCVPVGVPTDRDHQCSPEAIAAAIGPRTRAVVTISPNNPSGAVYPEATLRDINALCRERGVFHISDEAYEYFTYGSARHFSPAAIAGSAAHTIALYSLSKAYGFAAWRIGYQVIPEQLMAAVAKAQDTNLICPPVISQVAATAALAVGSQYCRERLAEIEAVRAAVLAGLRSIADICRVPPADGAFYLLLEVDTPMRSRTLAERLIREYGVAVIPGEAFGLEHGCHLRVAYGALERDTARAGIDRLTRGLRDLVSQGLQ